MLRRVVQGLFLVIFLPLVIFQVPWVQNKTAAKLTEYLSKQLQTTVSMGKVRLGIFNQVKLQNFYLEDLQGDTLVYAGNLEVNHTGVFMLLFKRLTVESIRLEDATVNLHRLPYGEGQNFQFLVDYFAGGPKPAGPAQPTGKPLRLNLRHIYLKNVHFLKPDEYNGETFDVYIEGLEGHFDRFDLLGKQVDLSSLAVHSPVIQILLEEGKMLPAPPATAKPVAEMVRTDTVPFRVSVKDFDLAPARFSLTNRRAEKVRSTPADVLNYNYLNIFDLEIHLNNFTYSELDFTGQVEKIALKDSTGFVLENLSVNEAALNCNGMQLYGLQLKTPYTELGDTLVFRYKGTYHAWEDFVNEVKMEGRFHQSHVALRDVITFVPALKNNPFFKENSEEVLKIEGLVKGPVNRLDGRDLKIGMENQGLRLEGSFSTRNLAVPDEQYLHLDLKNLRTDVRTLRKLIPGFRPPDNFNTLGRLDFSGKFDGFFVDFVADGRLKTDIGRAEMNMNLKLREGKEKATYSGDLYLHDFDLGKWSGSKDFGKVTLDSHVKKGIGLTLNSVDAKVEGLIDSLMFKGYVYRNAKIDGQLTKNLFDGHFSIQENNLDLRFEGAVNFNDTLPTFRFSADVNKLDMRPLNLTSRDLQFFGKMENLQLAGKRFADLEGEALLRNFVVVKNRTDTLTVDSILLRSDWLPTERRKHFTVESSLGKVDVEGNFNIEKIPALFTQFLAQNYPKYAERLQIKPTELVSDTSKFDFSVKLLQLQDVFSFFEEKLHGFDESNITGKYDGKANEVFLEVEVPAWEYQDIQFREVYFRSKLKGPEGNVQVGVIETKLSETQSLSPVSLIGSVYQDTFEFLLISSNFYKILDNFNINGVVSLEDENAWRISFKQSDLVILNQTWAIDTDNYIRIGGGKIETENFLLSHDDQRIVLRNVWDDGLELQLQNYPIDSLDYVKSIKNHRLSGIGDLTVKVRDVFKFEGLGAVLRINDLTVNGDNYGILRLDASTPGLKQTLNGYLSIEHDTMELTADGYFNLPGFEPSSKRKWIKDKPLYFDFEVNIDRYPTRIVNYFVPEVQDVKGSLSAKGVRLYGLPSKPELDGEATVNHASFKIKPLQVTYRVPEGKVKISNTIFDAKGSWVYDRFNNRAMLDGGITHDHLKNFGLDLTIATERNKPFLGLETTEQDNATFYGTAVGTGFVRFKGSFAQPELYVNGRTSPGTHMYLPMKGTATTTRKSKFINFTVATLPTEENKTTEAQAPVLRGLNMEYDLELTPDAKMELIFDKSWGDVMQGTGNGKLNVILNRDGEFKMYGDYVISEGNYLFTLMNIGLNKPFIVEPGGIVSWGGSPYDATIKLNAVYSGLSTSVYNFIQEYLAAASDQAKDLARNSSPVDLKMQMTGKLLKPDIAFDISFQNLDSEVRNYAENKMRTVRLDPNELNRQVFGLLMLGQFLPSGYTIQAGDVGINTLSEMLSNQLSIYFTEFVSEFFTGNKLIQGIDFDISYNRYTAGSDNGTIGGAPSVTYTNNELRGRLKLIVNDKVSVFIGGNLDVGGGNQVYSTNNNSSEILVEYYITKDKRLKINAYNTTEPDFAGGRRRKSGVGLSFRKEFDSFDELINFRKKNKS